MADVNIEVKPPAYTEPVAATTTTITSSDNDTFTAPEVAPQNQTTVTTTPELAASHDPVVEEASRERPGLAQGFDFHGADTKNPQPMSAAREAMVYQATPVNTLGETAAVVDCPACGARQKTNTEYHSGNTTFCYAVMCGCCCLPLVVVPFMSDGFKDVEHKCAKCGTMLAVWHRSGNTQVVAAPRMAPAAAAPAKA